MNKNNLSEAPCFLYSDRCLSFDTRISILFVDIDYIKIYSLNVKCIVSRGFLNLLSGLLKQRSI